MVAPAFVPTAGVRDLGPLPASHVVDVAVALAPRDPSGLTAQVTLEYTPGTPGYRHFLTAPELAERYGPTPSAYESARLYFQTAGLTTRPSPDRLLLLVSGPSAKVAAAFHTSFESYSRGGVTFFSHPTPATLPGSVPWLGALGLGNETVAVPAFRPAAGQISSSLAGCSTNQPLPPCAVDSAYNASGLLAAGVNGTGYRIGVVDTYDGVETQATLKSDLSSFVAANGLRVGSVQYLYPVPTSKDLNKTSTGWGVEEALDLEWSRAMAPGATIDMTFAPDPSVGLYAAVDWLVAHQTVNILSLSWGEPDVGVYNGYSTPCASGCNATSDGSYTLLHPVLVDAVAEGIGVFAASGDCGAAEGTAGVSTSYPASDPAVTGVGGTVLGLVNGTYGSESGWSGNASGATSPGCGNQGGSGGGYSPFPRPWWQSGPGVPSKPATRGVPDVAALGGTSVPIVYNGFTTPVEGTSVSTPVWAGFAAIADQSAGAVLGSLNPSLYAIARGPSGPSALHDVTSGWNGYNATVGWDPVTGLGSPNLGRLAPLLNRVPSSATTLAVQIGASPRIGPPPFAATVYVSVSGGVAPYPLVDIDFGDGNASIAPNGNATHTYPHAGVYVARATAFDSASNSTISPPVAIVVGGRPLNVTLAASRTNPALGQLVTFTASVSGGTTPYELWYSFGDGSYLDATNQTVVTHAYEQKASLCAAVVAADSAAPPNGGLSSRVSLAVGGAAPVSCGNAGPLTANLSSALLAADLPGDLPLHVSTAGGAAPFSIQYVSDDPYVAHCDCGIFRLAGPHTVTAFVNDSLNEGTVSRLNVTMYPALVGAFSHSALAGTIPLTVTLGVAVSGGHLANATQTQWAFGDGTTATGSAVSHTFTTAGRFTVVGQLSDAGRGNTSAAYSVNAFSGSPGPLQVTASISPAVGVPAGTLVSFDANATGGRPPYQYLWNLGDNDSAFGPSASQTYSLTGCLGLGTCPLGISVIVRDSSGSSTSAAVSLAGALAGQESAGVFADTAGPTSGATPLHFNASAGVAGLSGLNFLWSFGDGSATAGAVARHTYYSAGNFTAVITASSPAGDDLVRSHAVTVTGPPRSPPRVASGGPSPGSGVAPANISFAATGAGGGGPPYTFGWSFGDGGSAVGSPVTHVYPTAGRFNATVTVTDALGDTNSSVYPLTIYNQTWVALVVSVDRPSVPAGGTVGVSVGVDPLCTRQSAPGCGLAQVRLSFSFVSRTPGGQSFPGDFLPPSNASGRFEELSAPTVPGSYFVNVSVLGPAYSGSAEVALSVTSAPGGLLLTYTVSPPMIVGVGVVVGVLAALSTWRLSSPSRPREGPGGRPDA